MRRPLASCPNMSCCPPSSSRMCGGSPSSCACWFVSLSFRHTLTCCPSGEHRRRIYGYTGLTALKYLLSVLIGCIIGCIAFCLEWSTSQLLALKIGELTLFHEHGVVRVVGVICVASMSLALLAGLLIQFIAPAAAGGEPAPSTTCWPFFSAAPPSAPLRPLRPYRRHTSIPLHPARDIHLTPRSAPPPSLLPRCVKKQNKVA